MRCQIGKTTRMRWMRGKSDPLLWAVPVLFLLSGASSCIHDTNCELNGVCEEGVCKCDAEWEGESCGQLKLGAPRIAYGGPAYGVTSWGAGPPVKNPDTGKYVLFVTEIADGCGLSEVCRHLAMCWLP